MRNDVLTVYVDADSCPVKEEIGHLCKKYNKKLVFVASYAHEINPSLGAELVTVDSRAEEADLYIVNHCRRGDVVVTQDHGLAGLLLPKGVNVISPRGKIFLEEDMNELLFTRHLGKIQRRAGMKTKGPKKIKNEDILMFYEEFEKILSKLEGV